MTTRTARKVKARRATAGTGQVLYTTWSTTPGDKYFVLPSDRESVERMVEQADRDLWQAEQLRAKGITTPGNAEIVFASAGITAKEGK